MKLTYVAGATPITAEELQELIPPILSQKELNELEKANIAMAIEWASRSRNIKRELLSVTGLLNLHSQMFKKVWTWAGVIRQTEKNIGVAPHNIQTDLYNLCEDVRAWIKHKSYSWDEIGVRFHHRLVFIHPFANGNGRHARIAADLLLQFNNNKVFTWGSKDLSEEGDIRSNYLTALRKADQQDYSDLLKFSRM